MIDNYCWICKDIANSFEHMIKNSDLKMIFDNVCQQNSIVRRENGVIDKKNIQSTKSNEFKFNNLICAKCNNQITQPHDKSWEKLSTYLHTNWMEIKKNQCFNLKDVFGENFTKDMLNVHLYFVKIFGCVIEEEKLRQQSNESISIEMEQFSDSILNNMESDNIYISFRDTEFNTNIEYVGLYLDSNYSENYVFLLYIVGNITINIIFSKVNNKNALSNAQKPSEMSNIVNLVKYNDISDEITR